MNRLTIGAKLTIGFAVMAAVVLVSNVLALRFTTRLGSELDEAVNRESQRIDLIQALAKRIYEMSAAENRTVAAAMNGEAEGVAQSVMRYDAAGSRAREQIQQIEGLGVSQDGRGVLGEIRQGLESWGRIHRSVLKDLKESNYSDACRMLKEEAGPVLARLDQLVPKLVAEQRARLKEAAARANAETAVARIVVASSILLALAAGAFGFLLVRSNCATIQGVTKRLNESAERVHSASREVAGAGQSLAAGATEQAASLEETSASSEEITAMTRRNSEHSKEAANVMERVNGTVTSTQNTLQHMAESIRAIAASGSKISKIIRVIDEIAFQTNILALNAAVEAARAGEAGMGFAVVADEVRNLAQRCAVAASETSALIEEAVGNSSRGSAEVDQVVKLMAAAADDSAAVRRLVQEVSAGNEEQHRGVAEISRAISQIEQVTQRTASAAEESSAAAQELDAQSGSLQDIVREMRELVGAGRD